jgi:hypothetical protein
MRMSFPEVKRDPLDSRNGPKDELEALREAGHVTDCPEFSQTANRFNRGMVHDSAFPCTCIRTSLLRFTERAFHFHGPTKLLVDSPVVAVALEAYRKENQRNIKSGVEQELDGCPVERWLFPSGELLVPRGDATELKKRATPENIIREDDFPAELAVLAELCPLPLK